MEAFFIKKKLPLNMLLSRPMRPFLISIVASSIAMLCLWYYFDYLQTDRLGLKLSELNLELGLEEVSVSPIHKELRRLKIVPHWTLFFAFVPVMSFYTAVVVFFQDRIKPLPIIGIWIFALVLSVFAIGAFMADALQSPINNLTQPYADNSYFIPAIAFFGIILAFSIPGLGKNISIESLSFSDARLFFLPSILFTTGAVITEEVIAQIGPPDTSVGNFPFFLKNFFLSLEAQIIWSAFIVALWQLAFFRMVARQTTNSLISNKIDDIGKTTSR